MDRISALMDGEAGQTETQHALCATSNKTMTCSETLGDLPPDRRHHARAIGLLRDDFMARFHARIEQEPTQLAPRLMWRKSAHYRAFRGRFPRPPLPWCWRW